MHHNRHASRQGQEHTPLVSQQGQGDAQPDKPSAVHSRKESTHRGWNSLQDQHLQILNTKVSLKCLFVPTSYLLSHLLLWCNNILWGGNSIFFWLHLYCTMKYVSENGMWDTSIFQLVSNKYTWSLMDASSTMSCLWQLCLKMAWWPHWLVCILAMRYNPVPAWCWSTESKKLTFDMGAHFFLNPEKLYSHLGSPVTVAHDCLLPQWKLTCATTCTSNVLQSRLAIQVNICWVILGRAGYYIFLFYIGKGSV